MVYVSQNDLFDFGSLQKKTLTYSMLQLLGSFVKLKDRKHFSYFIEQYSGFSWLLGFRKIIICFECHFAK